MTTLDDFLTGVDLVYPAYAHVFTNGRIYLYSDRADIDYLYISSGRIEERRKLCDGVAVFDLLPWARDAFSNDGNLFPLSFRNIFTATAFNTPISLDIGLLTTAGVQEHNKIRVELIYASNDAVGVYGRERTITFPFSRDMDLTLTPLFTASVMLEDLGLQIETTAGEGSEIGLRAQSIMFNFPLALTLAGLEEPPARYSFTMMNAGNIVDGEMERAEVRVNVVRDCRTQNVIFLRWVDCFGLAHYRKFTKGERTQVSSTESEYQKEPINRHYGIDRTDYIDEGARKWQNKIIAETLAFGDDAIALEHYDDVSSILGACVVELNHGGEMWERVNVSDISLSVDERRHVFDFNANIILTPKNSVQW